MKQSGSNETHVLLVEDNPAHADMTCRILERGTLPVQVTVVETLTEARESLATAKPDLVLTDWNLPDGKGMELLPEEGELGDYPVILMTAFGTEEVAVEAVRAGAMDYIVKSDKMLDELEYHVERALREWRHITKRREAEEAMRESEKRYRSLVETTSDCIWEVNRNGEFTYISPNSREILGYRPDEILGKRPFDLMPPGERERCLSTFRELSSKRAPVVALQSTTIHKSGRSVIIETNGIPAFDESGRFLGYRGMDRDITARKRVEQALQATVEGTSMATVDDFFSALVQHLSRALCVRYAFVGTRVGENSERVRAIAACDNGHVIDNFEYTLAGTPCENAVEHSACWFLDNVQEQFPDGLLLSTLNAKSYLGVAFLDHSQTPLGVLAVLDDKPFSEEFIRFAKPLVELFATRAAAELERSRSEESLRLSEAKYRELVENSASIILRMDMEGRITFFNEFAEMYFGFGRDEIIGQSAIGTIIPPRETTGRNLAKMVQSVCRHPKSYASNENENIRRDGTRVWISWTNKPLLDDEGNVTELLCVGNDITERKQAEFKLRESEKQYSALFESAGDAIFMVRMSDGEPRIIDLNSAALKMLRGTREQVVGQRVIDVLAEEQPDGLPVADGVADDVRQATLESPYEVEKTFRRFDGSVIQGEARISPVEVNGTRHFVVIVIDIAERKRVQTEQAKAREAAEAANRAKSEFLANMSHEIRTPMTAILGFTDLLLDHASTPETIDAAKTVQRNGEHLLEIINNILDLSKIEAEKLDLESVECSPEELVRGIVELMAVPASAKGLSLDTMADGFVPKTVRTDPTRLRQMLINLVGNAIKFTETGRVTIRYSFEQLDGTRANLRFQVVDTGIGITQPQIDRIFKPFSQADTSMVREYGGSGLGLAISKRLAKLLGGDVQVTSVAGEGSTFTLTVAVEQVESIPEAINDSPVKSSSASPAPRLEAPTLPASLSCRILLAEDGPDNQRLISFMLRRAGADVTVAENGLVAVRCVQAAEEDHRPYDVILMDMQMPVLDGYDATKKLRSAGYGGPIVAITAHAMTKDRDKCLAVGCDDYLTKPIKRDNLLAMVARHVTDQPNRTP